MALITCPECGKKVSDIAPMCPNCGYPIAAMSKKSECFSKPTVKDAKTHYNYTECNQEEYKFTRGTFKYSGFSDAIIIPDDITAISRTSFKKVKAVLLGKSVKSVGMVNVEWFDVSESNPLFSAVDGVLYNKDQTEIIRYPSLNARKEYVIPLSVTRICSSAFLDSTKLETVVLHDHLIIEEESFKGSSRLKRIKWANNSYPDNSWPSAMPLNKNVFFHAGLTSFEFIDGITEIPCTLGWCPIKKLCLPESVKIIEPQAFSYCTQLKEVILPDSIDSIGVGAFHKCDSLEYCRLPNGLVNIPKGCFSECRSLKGIIIPKTVRTIGEGAFSYCESLNGILLPAGLKTIEKHAFWFCKSLNNLVLPDGIEVIGEAAFCGTEIKRIRVPDSAKEINDLCNSIPHVEISASTLGKMSDKTKQDKAKWDRINADAEEFNRKHEEFMSAIERGDFYTYQKNAKTVVKNREANKSRLAALLASHSLAEYNNLLLETNEINKTPICTYNECGQSLKLYDRNGMDGTFAIDINGRAYAINPTEYEIKKSNISVANDASQLDNGIIAGLVGGPLLGLLATSASQAYSTIDIHIPNVNKKTGDVIDIVFADHYTVRSSMATSILEKVQLFWNKFINVIDSISPEEIAAAGYINSDYDKIKRLIQPD